MTKKRDSLGDRMKGYENISRTYLTRRMPLIVRLDGKAFHTLTKKLDKPFDNAFKICMMNTARFLLENVMGCKMAYVQSDEISLLITDYDSISTEPWFKKNIQKIVSVTASMATVEFNRSYKHYIHDDKKIKDYGLFDSRAFVLPKEEVCNYMIWRQQDSTRNSIEGLGQANFSHKELQGQSCDKIQDMLMVQKDINWNDVDTYFKRGGCVYRDLSVKMRGPDEKCPKWDECVDTLITGDKASNIKKFKYSWPDKSDLKSVNKNDLDTDGDTNENGIGELTITPAPEEPNCQSCNDMGFHKEEAVSSNEVIVDYEIPIFTSDRLYIDQFVNIDIVEATKRKYRDIAMVIGDETKDPAILDKYNCTTDSDAHDLKMHFNSDETEERIYGADFRQKKPIATFTDMDGDIFEVFEGSWVIVNFITLNKRTQALPIVYNSNVMCWMFGNHSYSQLLEIDKEIKFSLIKE